MDMKVSSDEIRSYVRANQRVAKQELPEESRRVVLRLPVDSIGNYEIKKKFNLGKLTNNFSQDTFSFSAAGMRLNILYKGQKIEQISVRTWEQILSPEVDNAQLRDADDHISVTGKALERMLEIAEAAQDPSLSDAERIEMQIELGQLQHDMDEKNIPAGRLGVKAFEDTHSYKMLMRARDRINKGYDWNIREIRHAIVEDTADELMPNYEEVRQLYENGDDWIEYLKKQRPEWAENTYFEKAPNSDTMGISFYGEMRADPDDPTAKAIAYVWATTDDAASPTVGEILETTGRSVMDTDNATATAEELKQKLDRLEGHRKKLASLAGEYQAVQFEAPDSEEKQIILKKIMLFQADTLQNYFTGLFKDSFQFAYGDKFDITGKASHEPEELFENSQLPTEIPIVGGVNQFDNLKG